MAAGCLTSFAADRIGVRSAGAEAVEITPVAAEATREGDIEITADQPEKLPIDSVTRPMSGA
jgi:protein-tyrosine-phosphatase